MSLQENVSPTMIARLYEDEFKRDMLSLKVCPKVMDHIAYLVSFCLNVDPPGRCGPVWNRSSCCVVVFR